MSAHVDEALDLSDLDLLDDDRVHPYCSTRYPEGVQPGVPYVAWAGHRAIVWKLGEPGAPCQECLDIDICAHCGTPA